MKTIYFIIFIIKFKFVFTFEFNTPFYLKSNEKYFQVKHSSNREIQIITYNSSETSVFTLETAGKSFKTFSISTEKNKYKVLIFPQLLNPYIYDIPKEISMKLLCKFYYPLSSVGNNDNYICSFFNISNNNIRTLIGTCQLNLIATSCFCTITAVFTTENMKNLNDVLILAVVSKCHSENCHNNPKETGQDVTSTNLSLNFKNKNKLLWVNVFHGSSKMTVMLGLPRYSINKEYFELPIRLIKSPNTRILPGILIRCKTNVEVNYEISNIEDLSEFDFTYSTEERVYILLIKINDSIQYLKKSEVLIIMRLQITPPTKWILISFDATETNISQIKKDFHGNFSDSIPKFNLTTFSDGNLNVVPVIDRPLLATNLDNNRTLYTLKKEVFQLYFFYDGYTVDVQNKLQCHSLMFSKLRCPSNTKSFTYDNLDLIENKNTLHWAVAIKVEDWVSIVDIKPQIIYENVWEILISDQVLNEIDGWMGSNKTSSTTLLLDNECSMIYQVTPLKIYRKVTMYKEMDSNPIEMMVDVTKKIELKTVRIKPNIATIFTYGNHLMIQGNREGNFQLEIIDSEEKVMISENLKVSNNPVRVEDIEVKCISSINVTLNSMNFSFLINIHNITIDFAKFNKSNNCLILIDLIFNDTSRINLLTFPKQHYSVQFTTNRNVIVMDNDKDMFYNYVKFNKQTSFNVEIKESNGCKNPRTIFTKYVQFDKAVVTASSITTTSNIPVATTSTSSIMNTSITSTFHIIVYALCGVFTLILLILIIKFLKGYRRKRKLRYHLAARRKSGQKNIGDSQEKLEFGNSYPPLLPSPGPEVGIADNMNVALSSPQSFWCLNYNNNNHSLKKPISSPFTRQFSLPVKGLIGKDSHKYAQPCPPLRWIQKIMPEEVKMNVYSSQEALDTSPASNPCTNSPMCWSVVHMEGDQSSGIGSLMTNMDDFLKDPYELKDRFSRLSEIPRLLTDKNETVYEAI